MKNSNTNFLYLILLIFIAVSFQSKAQQNQPTSGGIDFQPLNSYRGGHIRDLKVIDANTLMFAGQGFGIGVFSNGSVEFKNPESLNPLNRHFETIAVDGNTIYAGGGADYLLDLPGFFKSTDEGETWELLGGQGENFQDMAVNQNIYPATDNQVYAWDGSNLSPIINGLTITGIDVIYYDDRDGSLQVGGDNGLATYNFGTSSWESNNLTESIVDIVKGEVGLTYYLTETKIFESVDKINYTQLYERADNGTFTSFAYCQPVQRLFTASAYPSYDVSNIPVGSFDINTNIFADESDGLPSNPGIPNVIETDDNYVHLGTSDGYFRRSKSTGPWENPTQIFNGSNVTAVSYNPYNNNLLVGTDYGDLKYSPDLSTSFIDDDENLPFERVWDIVPTTDGGNMIFQSQTIMWQSGPGQPFEQRENGSTLSFYRAAAVNPNNGVVVAGGGFGLIYSSDDGLSWSSVGFNDIIDKVVYSEIENKFFAKSFNKILSISADGQSFTIIADNINNPPPENIGIRDEAEAFELAMPTQSAVWILDASGNYLDNLTLTGLQPGDYLDKVAWSSQLNTWIGISSGGGFLEKGKTNSSLIEESGFYIYYEPSNTWEFSVEFLLLAVVLQLYFNNFSDGPEETIFLGFYGGGLWSNASSSAVLDYENTIVSDYTLEQNYPNPFNPSTTIQFAIPEESLTKLEVFNALGEKVSTLVSESLIEGNYKYEWTAKGLSSGVYFYKLQTESFIETKKMLLLK